MDHVYTPRKTGTHHHRAHGVTGMEEAANLAAKKRQGTAVLESIGRHVSVSCPGESMPQRANCTARTGRDPPDTRLRPVEAYPCAAPQGAAGTFAETHTPSAHQGQEREVSGHSSHLGLSRSTRSSAASLPRRLQPVPHLEEVPRERLLRNRPPVEPYPLGDFQEMRGSEQPCGVEYEELRGLGIGVEQGTRVLARET